MISGPFKPTRTCRVLHRFSPVKTLHHYFFGTLDEWIDGILISWIPNVFTNILTNFFLSNCDLRERVVSCILFSPVKTLHHITFGTQIGTLNESMSWFLVPWPTLSIYFFFSWKHCILTFGTLMNRWLPLFRTCTTFNFICSALLFLERWIKFENFNT